MGPVIGPSLPPGPPPNPAKNLLRSLGSKLPQCDACGRWAYGLWCDRKNTPQTPPTDNNDNIRTTPMNRTIQETIYISMTGCSHIMSILKQPQPRTGIPRVLGIPCTWNQTAPMTTATGDVGQMWLFFSERADPFVISSNRQT